MARVGYVKIDRSSCLWKADVLVGDRSIILISDGRLSLGRRRRWTRRRSRVCKGYLGDEVRATLCGDRYGMLPQDCITSSNPHINRSYLGGAIVTRGLWHIDGALRVRQSKISDPQRLTSTLLDR